MCGLTGFFTPHTGLKRSDLQAIGRRMHYALRHRGPDGQDIWRDPDVGLLLAHRRLSIIDLSDEGRQPMESASGRYIIVYNGEIYNYLALRDTLTETRFRGRSDTEVLLACIDQWGINQTLQKIGGMFAFALWDRQSRTLHFARDRFGKKPLYIGWAGDSLVFASELKALREHPDFEARIHPEALSLYMRYGYIPAPYCIYEGVWSLPAGHRLFLPTEPLSSRENLAGLMEPYWHHLRALEESRSRMTARPESEVIDEFEHILSACVQERLVSDVPLGAFLSGGIDSSAIVALMQAHSARPVKTYTIGFHESGFDEAAHARKIAVHLGTDHHEAYVTPTDALAVIPYLPDIYDEPFADISGIPTYLVSRFARHDVTVALTGDGGDEMLGGYTRHVTAPRLHKRIQGLPQPVRKFTAGAMTALSTTLWDRLRPGRPQFGNAVHKAASILALDVQEDIYNRLLSRNEDPPLLHALRPATLLNDPAWQPQGLTFAEDMMYRDTLFYMPNDILVKTDRATMAASLEARAPLIDRKIYEYVWSLPLQYKIRNGKGKWLLHQVLKRHVPEGLFERPKQGFGMPVGAWLRGPLRGWAESLLNVQDDPMLDDKKISALWTSHLEGRGNHADALWAILMFRAWQERWA